MADNPVSDKTINDLIKKYAPVLYFHPDEAYMPWSVDSYLQHCSLITSSNSSQTPTKAVNLDDLANAGADSYLQLFGSNINTVRAGNRNEAHAYVNVVSSPGPGLYEIQYWFFYPFNGPATLRLDGTVGGSVDNEIPPVGQHDSDWEHIAVRIDGNGAIVSAYFAQHSGGQWYAPASAPGKNDGFYTWNNTSQIIVYVAKNTHASYPWSGDFTVADSERDYGALTITVRDKTAYDPNKVWNCADSNVLQTVNINAPGLSALKNPPKWVSYTGKWAADENQSLTTSEVLQVIGQAFVAAPWLIPLLTAAGAALAVGLIAQAQEWDENGISSPPWNQSLPQNLITGNVVIYNWNCLQHQKSMVLSVDQNNGLVLTEFVLGSGTPRLEQQWLCVPNTSPDAPAGSYTLINMSTRQAPSPPAKDGSQITLGASTTPNQDPAYAWVLVPQSEDGAQLWAIRSPIRGNVMDASQGGCSDQAGNPTKVIYHSWNTGDNQRWRLNPA